MRESFRACHQIDFQPMMRRHAVLALNVVKKTAGVIFFFGLNPLCMQSQCCFVRC
ncbi:hypothetical protein PC119_g20560, partial [Phytophthora cactorum]